MKTKSKMRAKASKDGTQTLAARLAEAEKQVETARQRARLAKAQFKQARKAFKQAKRAAKQLRKAAKAAAKSTKVRAKKALQPPKKKTSLGGQRKVQRPRAKVASVRTAAPKPVGGSISSASADHGEAASASQ